MIRILHIMDHVAINSGVSTVVLNIYRNMDRNKIQFDFLLSRYREYSYEKEILQYGGKIVYIGNPLSITSLINSCKNSKEFFEKNSINYVAVHLHSPTIAEMTIRYAKKYKIKNIIVHSHSSMFSDNPFKRVMNRILVSRLDSFATHFWYCSDKSGEFLFGKNYLNKKNSQWIRNGIETKDNYFDKDIRKEIRNKYNIDNCKIACHVSNFSPIKNVEFLIGIIEQVVRRDRTWRFLFVGEGKYKKRIEEKISIAGLSEYCLFFGFSNQVNKFLNGADILLLPSIKEGLPVVVIEAQACGLPCVLTDTITKQVDIGGVRYLSMEQKRWANFLLKFVRVKELERVRASSDFLESPFNIHKEAKRIEELYLEMENEK